MHVLKCVNFSHLCFHNDMTLLCSRTPSCYLATKVLLVLACYSVSKACGLVFTHMVAITFQISNSMSYFWCHSVLMLTVMCHHSETSSMWVWHWRVIVKGQTTSGSVVAVEPILKVNPRLTDDIIGPHEIVVHYSDNQLCFQWERYREFKHPERKGKACRDVRRSVKSECI